MQPYDLLTKKRLGRKFTVDEIRAVVRGVTDRSWSDPQLAAFLMAVAIRGLCEEETHALTMAMLESGEQWKLADEIPHLVDKHSTGGVGDKVSLVLAPILAACDVPVIMLTGRALGHTAGTADKLESIPGLSLDLDRARCLRLLREQGIAIGVATTQIAPADRYLYRLRDHTATVESLPLITASILSKKLASGAAALVFDVKTGDGAFMRERREAARLALMLVRTCSALGRPASALITDMSQPLGTWIGHLAEVREALECLAGDGPAEVMEVTLALAEELMAHLGIQHRRRELEAAVSSGRAREVFDRWARAQGADAAWMGNPRLDLAPHETVLEAPRAGVVRAVATRRLGLLMVRAGGGRLAPSDDLDFGVALRYAVRLAARVEKGQELARLYLRRPDETLKHAFAECFEIGDAGEAPALIVERVAAG